MKSYNGYNIDFDTFEGLWKKYTSPSETTENNMDINYSNERRSIENELYRIKSTHCETLQEKYYITPPQPENAAQAFEWIKSGNYIVTDEEVFKDEDDGDFCYREPWYTAGFRFGKNEADRKGFNAAYEKMKEQYNNLIFRNKIIVPTDILKEVESFRKMH